MNTLLIKHRYIYFMLIQSVILMYFTYTMFMPAYISLEAGLYAKHKASIFAYKTHTGHCGLAAFKGTFSYITVFIMCVDCFCLRRLNSRK